MQVDTLSDRFLIDKKKRAVADKISSTVVYSPSVYGVDNKCTGKGVKVAILDSGCTNHKDIKFEGDKISFCEDNTIVNDKNGHSTMMAGIIKSNNRKSIIGLAPHSKLLFSKVVNHKGECSFNSLVAGVLWSIVKGADIIVIAMGSQYDYRVLHDAVKKAREHDICIFAASGDEDELDFPARYEEVFSAGFLTRSKKKNEIIKKNVDFYLPNKGLYTTYLENKYVRISGSSVSTAFFAGIAAVLVEQYKKENKKNISKLVYAELDRIFNK
jgi:major intracellular serine protease